MLPCRHVFSRFHSPLRRLLFTSAQEIEQLLAQTEIYLKHCAPKPTTVKHHLDVVQRNMTQLTQLNEPQLAEAFSEQELLEEKQNIFDQVASDAEMLEEALLHQEDDEKGCFLEITAGAGGEDAFEWAQMLQRMYLLWAKTERLNGGVVEETLVDGGGGIKSCTLTFDADNSMRWLRHESGTHRLVRISPFDKASRRHTSFARVYVYPLVEKSNLVELDAADLRIDTFRASGAGGQHVNTTDSAIRITHKPTGLVAQCQTNRSQHVNKRDAMNLLIAKIRNLQVAQAEKENHDARSSLGAASFGAEVVRNYQLHPSQRVRCTRSLYTVHDANSVLDGQSLSPMLKAARKSIFEKQINEWQMNPVE